MNISLNKKIVLFLLIIFGLSFSSDVLARGVSGWAWSNNIGWISFNSRNCDPNGNGTFEGTAEGAPAHCPSTGTSIAYAVSVAADGNLIGHAWSQNIGWIDFDPVGPYPATPNHSARVDNPGLATSTVSGWARVLAHGDGWDGWINMRGPNYGVTVDFTINEFSGWAWSNMVTGWISFNCNNPELPTPRCTNPYRATIFNVVPEVRPPFENIANHCLAPQRHTFSWTFHDPGDTQIAYQVQVATNTAFSPLFIDSGRVTSTAVHNARVSFAPLDLFAWNTGYHWRVRVWDSFNATSTWSATNSFTTQVHRPPNVRFSWSPIRPIINEVVQFTDNTECFGPGAGGTATTICASWSWEFIRAGATIGSSTLQHPTTTFSVAGRHDVRLTVTDPTGTGDPAFNCTLIRSIDIGTAPPIWIEIPPIIWLRNFWASVVDVTNGLTNRIIALINNL